MEQFRIIVLGELDHVNSVIETSIWIDFEILSNLRLTGTKNITHELSLLASDNTESDRMICFIFR